MGCVQTKNPRKDRMDAAKLENVSLHLKTGQFARKWNALVIKAKNIAFLSF